MIRVLTIFLIMNVALCYAQDPISKGNLNSCKCIDNLFSSSKEEPIATVKQDDNYFSFCGYKSNSPINGREYGVLRTDSSMLLCGYELIDCQNTKSIFYEGEYYTDSVKIHSDGFEIFRLKNIPNINGGKYFPVPIIEFKVKQTDKGLLIDTIFALPQTYYSKEYIAQVENVLNDMINNKSRELDIEDYQLHLLFLKALNNESDLKQFNDAGTYDGYLGPIYRDFGRYIKIKLEDEKNTIKRHQ